MPTRQEIQVVGHVTLQASRAALLGQREQPDRAATLEFEVAPYSPNA